MSDIFIRRDVDGSRRHLRALLAWGIAAVAILLIGAGALHLRRPDLAAQEPEVAAEAKPATSGPMSVPPPPMPADPSTALLNEGRALKEAGRFLEARAKLFEALAVASSDVSKRAIEELLGALHIALVFSPHPMEEKVDYVVQRGDSLARIAARFGTTVDLIQRSHNITDPNRIRIGTLLRILQGRFFVQVSKSRNELELRLNDRFFKRYRVGTGKYNLTPTGRTKIVSREKHPTWWRPDGTSLPYGHPENVLGTHWLGLEMRGYGIHGTWEPQTIGRYESAGCIRLLNEDIEELYTLLPVGVEVWIED